MVQDKTARDGVRQFIKVEWSKSRPLAQLQVSHVGR